ncbi:MAG: NAD(P)H-dependent oxidoreductase, partial [Patescibacteria group bacterium]
MSAAPLKVLVLNASLKHGNESSSTEEVAALVVEKMKGHAEVEAEVLRLSDMDIPVGLGYKESETDEWPAVVEKLVAADIVLFATPIWWGGRSSLMQRVIERMDAF